MKPSGGGPSGPLESIVGNATGCLGRVILLEQVEEQVKCHRVRVSPLDDMDRYQRWKVAWCICGWVGRPYLTRGSAGREGAEHEKNGD